jgi:hypothetical protein
MTTLINQLNALAKRIPRAAFKAQGTLDCETYVLVHDGEVIYVGEGLGIGMQTTLGAGVDSLPGLRLNEHLAHDGESVFQHACKMGLKGIVSKRLGSRYRSGQSPTRVRRRYGCGTMLGTSALSPGRGKG